MNLHPKVYGWPGKESEDFELTPIKDRMRASVSVLSYDGKSPTPTSSERGGDDDAFLYGCE